MDCIDVSEYCMTRKDERWWWCWCCWWSQWCWCWCSPGQGLVPLDPVCTLTRGCRSCKILSLMRPFWDQHSYWDDVDTCDWWRNTSKYGATMERYQFTCLWEVPQSSRGTRGSLWSRPYHTPSSSKHTSCTTLLVPHFYLTVASVGTMPHFFLTVAHFILIPLFWPHSHSPPSHSFRL